MENLHLLQFIDRFCDKTAWTKYCQLECKSIISVKNAYFLVGREQLNIYNAHKCSKYKIKPDTLGIFLGKMEKIRKRGKIGNIGNDKGFQPSTALLSILAQLSKKKIFIGKKAEWLFLCGRDVFQGSVESVGVGYVAESSAEHAGSEVGETMLPKKGSFVLVQNSLDENLGYGIVCAAALTDKNTAVLKPNEVVVKNLLDKGSFLRRER